MTGAVRPGTRGSGCEGRSRLATLLVLVAVGLALDGCRRREPARAAVAPPPPAPTSSAHPPEFVHPQIEPSPTPEGRPECSNAALTQVAARMRDVQKSAAIAATARGKLGKSGKQSGCGSPRGGPAAAALDQQVKGELDDRVRGCVGQDGPLDAEWNSLSYGLSSLGVCLDCERPPRARRADCQRALDVVNRALADAQAKSQSTPAPAGPAR